MKKETLPFMVYGYFVTISSEYRDYYHCSRFDKLGNAQKYSNQFRGVGSIVKIYFDGHLLMQKSNTQKF